MNKSELKELAGFFENELVNRFLYFWLPQCADYENGGFVNCFTNSGDRLISKDKYCWSQGRFVWIFSKLASLEAPVFSQKQRSDFLALAKHGAEFLMAHCLMGPDDWRCVFLMDEAGRPKYVEGCDRLDMSIYADCFAAAGIARYAAVSGDRESYAFAKKLYESITERVRNNDFQTLPYPLSKSFRAHGIPMILCNVSRDIFLAAERLDSEYAAEAERNMLACSADILDNFVDENYLLHEVIMAEDNSFFPKTLGNHINPGHTLEDSWFHLDALELMESGEERDSRRKKVYNMALKAIETGWDSEYGGIYHFSSLTGGRPEGDNSGLEEETMSKQLEGWGDKLWWVHSEAMYTLLRCYFETGDERFRDWFKRVFAYVYDTFPNTDPEIREWKQIRNRRGEAIDSVVALPVKDPYHVIRNLELIIELIYSQLK